MQKSSAHLCSTRASVSALSIWRRRRGRAVSRNYQLPSAALPAAGSGSKDRTLLDRWAESSHSLRSDGTTGIGRFGRPMQSYRASALTR